VIGCWLFEGRAAKGTHKPVFCFWILAPAGILSVTLLKVILNRDTGIRPLGHYIIIITIIIITAEQWISGKRVSF
jgi:hypothetical protein